MELLHVLKLNTNQDSSNAYLFWNKYNKNLLSILLLKIR